jgi:ribonucleoside-diphosphate reductase alpha chain
MLKIEYCDGIEDVYDITVADNENFYANDILVHNCTEITLPVRPMGSTKTVTHTVGLEDLQSSVAAWVHDGGEIKKIVPNIEKNTFDVTVDHEDSRIALCTLSAINWGKIKKPSDFEKPCRLAVRALDALLDYQHYPVVAARLSTMEHRPVGVGIINFAYWLASNGLKYTDDSALTMVDEYAEAWSYYLIKESVELAKEKGACGRFDQTKYSQGIMPIDTRKLDVDELVLHVERMPWAKLREEAKLYGIRNATLMALMPAETSAQIANATNGIEPPRAFVSIKQSKDGVLAQVVPKFEKLKNKYELLWDQKSPIGYLKICAILQKYIDQAISVNSSYNPKFYPEEKIPLSELLQHLLLFYKWGGKNLYYFNTNDSAGEVDVNRVMNVDNSIGIIEEDECSACKI